MLAANLGLGSILLDHLVLGKREESGVGRIGHEVAGLSERIERVDRGVEGVGRRHHGRGGGQRIMRAIASSGLIGRELIHAVRGCGGEGVERIAEAVGGGVRAAQTGVDSAHIIARTGKIERGAVRLNGILRTLQGDEAIAEARQGASRGGVGPVDSSLAVGHTGLREVAELLQSAAEAEVGLVRGGVAGILGGSGEGGDGRGQIAGGDEGLALVGEQRALLAIGVVLQRDGISSRRLGITTEAHERVAAEMVGLAPGLVALFGSGEQLGRGGKVAGAVSAAGLFQNLSVHMYSLDA